MRPVVAACLLLAHATLPAVAQTLPFPSTMPLPTGGAECGAARLQSLVGGPLPESLPGPNPVRIYADGDAVTMDYNPQRVNIILDAATRSTVLAVTCG